MFVDVIDVSIHLPSTAQDVCLLLKKVNDDTLGTDLIDAKYGAGISRVCWRRLGRQDFLSVTALVDVKSSLNIFFVASVHLLAFLDSLFSLLLRFLCSSWQQT